MKTNLVKENYVLEQNTKKNNNIKGTFIVIITTPGSILQSCDTVPKHPIGYMQFHQFRIINSLSPWLVQIRRYYTQTVVTIQQFIQSKVIAQTTKTLVWGFSRKVDSQSLNLPRRGQSTGTVAMDSTCKEIVISILLVKWSVTMLSLLVHLL